MMTGLEIFALIVLFVLVCTGIGVVVVLGILPGKVAAERNHPYREAIQIGSWVALIAGGVLWPLLLIWAYATPESEGEDV